MRSRLCFDKCFAQRAKLCCREGTSNLNVQITNHSCNDAEQKQDASGRRLLKNSMLRLCVFWTLTYPDLPQQENPITVKSRSRAEHLKSKAVDADDAWLAQLDPAVQSLLIKKRPLHLTTLDRAEARYSLSFVLAPCIHLNCNRAPGAYKLLCCHMSDMCPDAVSNEIAYHNS